MTPEQVIELIKQQNIEASEWKLRDFVAFSTMNGATQIREFEYESSSN